jgi:FMN phosphatase YigB (HAD superfamily)
MNQGESVKPLKCLVFDAYGTLFDVHSIVAALEQRQIFAASMVAGIKRL